MHAWHAHTHTHIYIVIYLRQYTWKSFPGSPFFYPMSGCYHASASARPASLDHRNFQLFAALALFLYFISWAKESDKAILKFLDGNIS